MRVRRVCVCVCVCVWGGGASAVAHECDSRRHRARYAPWLRSHTRTAFSEPRWPRSAAISTPVLTSNTPPVASPRAVSTRVSSGDHCTSNIAPRRPGHVASRTWRFGTRVSETCTVPSSSPTASKLRARAVCEKAADKMGRKCSESPPGREKCTSASALTKVPRLRVPCHVVAVRAVPRAVLSHSRHGIMVPAPLRSVGKVHASHRTTQPGRGGCALYCVALLVKCGCATNARRCACSCSASCIFVVVASWIMVSVGRLPITVITYRPLHHLR